MTRTILIRNGRLIDPARAIDERGDLLLQNGRIAAFGRVPDGTADETIDAGDRIVAPGLIDMHVHLREPGHEHKETIATGSAAAVAGGFSAVACMPNTSPPLHDETQIEYVRRVAAQVDLCRVYPIGALTRERAGKQLAEIGLMVQAGAVAFSDDGDGVADAGVCLRAMQYLTMFDRLLIQHCEDKSIAGAGVMHAGVVATRLGLPGIAPAAEELMAERDVRLSAQAGVRYHVAHISTAGCVEIVRRAKADGRRVTTEVCPHHLLLTDEACTGYDPNFKMNPPLRTATDVEACRQGVRDGTIDCLVTDHAPHTAAEKELGFVEAPMGIVGLETALPLFVEALVTPGLIDWPRLIHGLSTRPAELLGVPGGSLAVGELADVTIIDPAAEWTIDPAQFRSKGRNTPFAGRRVLGRATHTIVGGHVRYALAAAS